jgi:hypothetical protein
LRKFLHPDINKGIDAPLFTASRHAIIHAHVNMGDSNSPQGRMRDAKNLKGIEEDKRRKTTSPVLNKPIGSYTNRHTAKHSKTLFLYIEIISRFLPGVKILFGFFVFFTEKMKKSFKNL